MIIILSKDSPFRHYIRKDIYRKKCDKNEYAKCFKNYFFLDQSKICEVRQYIFSIEYCVLKIKYSSTNTYYMYLLTSIKSKPHKNNDLR